MYRPSSILNMMVMVDECSDATSDATVRRQAVRSATPLPVGQERPKTEGLVGGADGHGQLLERGREPSQIFFSGSCVDECCSKLSIFFKYSISMVLKTFLLKSTIHGYSMVSTIHVLVSLKAFLLGFIHGAEFGMMMSVTARHGPRKGP